MNTSWRQHLRYHPRVVDAGMSVLLFLCSGPGSALSLPGSDLGIPWWPGVVLSGVSCVALLWHRSHPRATVAVTAACTAAVAVLGYLLTILLLAPLMAALYSLAFRSDR